MQLDNRQKWNRATDPPVGANGMYTLTSSGRRVNQDGFYIDATPRTKSQVVAEFTPAISAAHTQIATAPPSVANAPYSVPVPRGPVIPSTVSGTTQLSVADRQKLLRSRGFDVAVDGVLGPQTNTAWRAFLKGVPSSYWNHAWTSNHTPQPPPVDTGATDATDTTRQPASASSDTGAAAAPPAWVQQWMRQLLTPYKPPTTAEMLQQARMIAGTEISPQIADLRTQQAEARAQAQHDAQFEANLGQALARVLKGIAPQTEAAYQTAGADIADLAHGYSGDLRKTAIDSAQDVNVLLDQLGAPAGQRISPQRAEDAANVVYGLAGAIPGAALAREGAAYTAAAAHLPATEVGLGLQNSANALAAGRDQTAKLAAQLATLETQRPGLVNTALTSLQNQAVQNAGLDQNAKLLGLTAARQFEDLPGTSPFTGRPTKTQVSIDEIRAKVAQGARKLTIDEQRAASALARDQIAVLKAVRGPQLTPNERAKWNGTANTIALSAHNGIAKGQGPSKAWNAAHPDGAPALLYTDAIDEMLKAGVPWEIAQAALNRAYAPGERGRPITIKSGGPLGVTAYQPA